MYNQGKMNKSPYPSTNPIDWIKRIFDPNDEDMRFSMPFFIILTVVLTVIGAVSVFSSPDLQQPKQLIPFIFLLVLHIALHWLSPYLNFAKPWSLPYLSIQGALVFVISWLMGNPTLGIGLYMALIGEAVGILRKVRMNAVAITVYLVLSLLNFFLYSGWESVRSWAISILPMTIFVVTYVILFTRQADARASAVKLAHELEEANQQLAAYADKIQQLTLTTERQRMARELHDTLSQGLAGTILQLEAADSHLSNQRPERAQTIIRQAMERARTTLADARRVIDDLRSGIASNGTELIDSIQAESNHFTTAFGVPVELTLNIPDHLSERLKEQIYRIISEFLTNTARHAHASQVKICIEPENQQVKITAWDNGIGFNPDQEIGKPGHYGLLGLRERVRLANGQIEIKSSPKQGTCLTVNLPMDQESIE